MYCVFQIPKEEVDEIERFVMKIAKDFLPKTIQTIAARHNHRFSVKEVISAGSYFEQTKIKLPNEFDFMVVVKELSSPTMLSVQRGCKPGYAKVQMKERSKWYNANDWSPEKELQTTILGFNAYVRQAVSLAPVCKGRYGTLTFKSVEVRGKPYSVFSHVQTANFTWKRKNNEEFLYTRDGREESGNEDGFTVCVDMMTCCHLPLSIFRDILSPSARINLSLIKHGCHVVLKPCNTSTCMENDSECRLISYTKSEVEKMHNLDENWKIVYRVAKWLFAITEYVGIDSYKLKTTVLHLSAERGHIELGNGFILLLKSLLKSASTHKLNSHFNESLNVWSIPQCYSYFTKWQILLLLKIFKCLASLSRNEYNKGMFSEILEQWFVHSCKHSVEINNIRRNIFDEFSQEAFNVQGNSFLEIVDDMTPVLNRNKTLKWVPFQMKMLVLADVLKFLLSKLMGRIVVFFRSFL